MYRKDAADYRLNFKLSEKLRLNPNNFHYEQVEAGQLAGI